MEKSRFIETRVKREYRYPIEFAGEDIRNWCPSMLTRLTTEEVCAIDRGNINSISEILEESGIGNDAYSSFARAEMEKDGYEVFHTETYGEGDAMVVICHAIKYEDDSPRFNSFSLN